MCDDTEIRGREDRRVWPSRPRLGELPRRGHTRGRVCYTGLFALLGCPAGPVEYELAEGLDSLGIVLVGRKGLQDDAGCILTAERYRRILHSC